MIAATLLSHRFGTLLYRLPFPWFRSGMRRPRFGRAYDRYLQRRALADLDDHLRRDVGLTAEEIRRECRKLF